MNTFYSTAYQHSGANSKESTQTHKEKTKFGHKIEQLADNASRSKLVSEHNTQNYLFHVTNLGQQHKLPATQS